MTQRLVHCATALLVTFGIHAATAIPCWARSPQTPVTSLSQLEFISGRWAGELNGGKTDEHWSAPSGDNMMGVFRYVKNGRAVFFEMMLIEMTTVGPVLRLKHFNPGLIGWEEKDHAYSYPLVELTKNRAAFERTDKQTRLIFHRTSEHTMTVTLEQIKDGKPSSEEFKYQLVR
jgi:hypothetical protein